MAAEARTPRMGIAGLPATWLITLASSRGLSIAAASCAALYCVLLALALLQNRGVIDSRLPIPVMDSAIIRRSHAELRPEAVTTADVAHRTQLLSQARSGSGSEVAAPLLTLEIEATPPARLWIVDSQGSEIGANPFSGLVMSLMDASYSGEASPQQRVAIGAAEGEYRIFLVGIDSGNYILRVRLMADGDLDHAVQYGGGGHVFRDTLLRATARVALNGRQPQLTVSSIEVVKAADIPVAADGQTDDGPVQDPQAIVRLGPSARLPLPLPGVVSSGGVEIGSPASSTTASVAAAAPQMSLGPSSQSLGVSNSAIDASPDASKSGGQSSASPSSSSNPGVASSSTVAATPTPTSLPASATSTPMPGASPTPSPSPDPTSTAAASPSATPTPNVSVTATTAPATATATRISSASPTATPPPTRTPTSTTGGGPTPTSTKQGGPRNGGDS